MTVWRVAGVITPPRTDTPRQASLASQVRQLGELLGLAIQRLPMRSVLGAAGSVQKM